MENTRLISDLQGLSSSLSQNGSAQFESSQKTDPPTISHKDDAKEPDEITKTDSQVLSHTRAYQYRYHSDDNKSRYKNISSIS